MPFISQLYIYPVKSLGGIALQQTLVTSRGLQYDRRWMLIDDDNQFLSQRKFPKMALFRLKLLYHGIQVTYQPNGAIIIIPLQPQTTEQVKVKICDDECTATIVSNELNQWFSKLLALSCRLVYMSDDDIRPVDFKYAGTGHITSFSDGYPTLLVSEASLADLNTRLVQPVPINRFRPNIVISGNQPYLEDRMLHFTIKDIDFYGVKPCARCVMVGVDHITAINNAEPLKTLAGYRKSNNKIYFGQNLIHKGEQQIKVGDELQIHELGMDLQLNATAVSV